MKTIIAKALSAEKRSGANKRQIGSRKQGRAYGMGNIPCRIFVRCMVLPVCLPVFPYSFYKKNAVCI